MAFDIHQKVVDQDGELLEKRAREYQNQLTRLFLESPEGRALIDEDVEGGWANMMMDYGLNYLHVTPPQMSPGDLREILFDLFPRKVSAEADEAPNIIRELQAFWTFLQREFRLENAADCLKILDDSAVRRLRRDMSDPANFDMAKSIVMMGKARGFDMTTEEGINEWITTYNAEMAAGFGQRSPTRAIPTVSSSVEKSPTQSQFKFSRKTAKSSHKKNRKKR